MKVTQTRLKGLFYIELDVFADERGNFREAWQAEKMTAAGLPDFKPVQNNISESKRGVTRGVHAEPWDKYIHVPFGTAFAAVADLREDSPTFGECETFELGQGNALFVERGFGNSYQVTSDWAAYSYLVTEHWQAGVTYPAIALDDPDLAIAWPLAREEWILSEKDMKNPTLRAYYPHKS